jgi:hemerythrin-like domain-containing protein
MDAIEFLRNDHENVLGMMRRLEESPTAVPGSSDDVAETRHRMATELVVAESQHEAVEEQFFWPTVRDTVPGGKQLAARAQEQESEAKKLLDTLDKTAPSDPQFEQLIDQVIRDGREHIEYEQNSVWPKVREALSQEELDELGDKMAKAKQAAPTRPHPQTPSTPGAQKTAGPMAALMDRVRDALSGRRKH